ncbi:hypothetical protein M8C21_004706 [Ambrosia artemisiifolia]|uniref:Uncharacterized protein n=1 Tax=Ambrosia artemisiifolia TaxID=4212 RepID=A0AAD5D5R8_AMBAR|nr:hypothetical protein M8C21_004706 [Ambrosia artemisiifolia]
MSQGASGKQWQQKLTLENYLNLEHMDTISLHILRKDDILDAVRSIELMDAHRSTLQSDDVSSNAFLSLNDVIRDLSLLQWQECCITHIETINSVTDFGEEPSPKPLKRDCKRSTAVNGPDKLGSPVTDFGEEPSPKHLKRDCNQSTVVNGPDKLASQNQIIDQNSIVSHTATKRSERVKKAPTIWKDFVMGATLRHN